MSQKEKLFFALLALEVVLLLPILPSSLPHNQKTNAAFSKWQKSHSHEDELAFRNEMDRLTLPERRVRRVALVLLAANSTLLVIVGKRKSLREQS
jgi:hypothetical protein